MIRGLLVLLGCQLVGELLAALLGLHVPGPVLGMVLLLGLLTWRRPGPASGVVRVSEGLLRHLQLLFVPAGAGVFSSLTLIGASAVPLVAGLVLSWGAALLTAAGVALLLLRWRPAKEGA
ncbi:CidA/LrgA family protein [Nocardioides caldifontis]|uniref:CidA/LrgA family protein n=1 Tax=Nocardioides caldifontis TaxID=2588938 RepID=UPI0011DF8F9B|nr:CidA/LrgA family protein [Nocardioides caldifontis]